MMKTLLLIAWALSLSLTGLGQGIVFEELSYADALAKARNEQKLLFVDCYTTWCGPCKVMAAEVFTLKEAGDYFTPRFVAVKYDMEKGEGIELRKQLGVKSYPTFLIVRPDGAIAHRVVGSSSWPSFVQKLERGINPKSCLDYLDKQYKLGKLDTKGVIKYRQALEDAYDTRAAKEVSDELLAKMTRKERLLPEAWPVLGDAKISPFASGNYDFILENREKLAKRVGREEVEGYFHEAWSAFLVSLRFVGRPNATDNPPPANHEELLQQLKRQVANASITGKEFMLAKCAAAEAALKNDRTALVRIIRESFSLLPADDKGEILAWLNLSGRSREAYAEMAGLYDEYLKALPGETYPEWVKHNGLTYRKNAQAGLYFEPFSLDEALSWGGKRWESNVYAWLYTPGDNACREMETAVFAGERANAVSRGVVCVKFDVNSPEGTRLREQYAVPGLSSIHLLLKPDGTEISRLTGTPDEDAFVRWMQEYSKRPER